MNVPIIRIELERMKHTMCAMLSEHAVQLDADMRAAIEAYCSEEALSRTIREEARRCIDAAVKEEIQRFFGWSGAGRAAIREAVLLSLDERFPTQGE